MGDTITLTSFTKSGYLRSINVKVWGIYVIEGLESSDIASRPLNNVKINRTSNSRYSMRQPLSQAVEKQRLGLPCGVLAALTSAAQ